MRLGDGAGPDDGGVARAWWDGLANAVAVRERGRATRELVHRAIVGRARAGAGREVRVASIAAGSARYVLEALRQVPAGVPVRACLLDWDEDAASYSHQLAGALGVGRRIEAIVGNAIRVRQHFAPRSLDLAEAVGLLDYLADGTTVRFLRQLRGLLRPGGTIVASNILPNEEREFLHTAMGWRAMHYRTEEDFVALFLRAGFAPGDLTLHRLPTGIYAIVEATLGAQD